MLTVHSTPLHKCIDLAPAGIPLRRRYHHARPPDLRSLVSWRTPLFGTQHQHPWGPGEPLICLQGPSRVWLAMIPTCCLSASPDIYCVQTVRLDSCSGRKRALDPISTAIRPSFCAWPLFSGCPFILSWLSSSLLLLDQSSLYLSYPLYTKQAWLALGRRLRWPWILRRELLEAGIFTSLFLSLLLSSKFDNDRRRLAIDSLFSSTQSSPRLSIIPYQTSALSPQPSTNTRRLFRLVSLSVSYLLQKGFLVGSP